jgi:hypothetical protein
MRKGIQGVLVLSLLISSLTLRADELVAHIRGVVTDPTSARVPGAEVVATNTDTKISTTVTTSGDGTFEFLSLAVGHYDVKVSKAGFKTFASRHITLQLNQVYDLPVPLQVGEVAQTVEVEAATVQVETSVTQMGTVMENQQINDLPILNRNWLTLEQLVPGAVGASDRFGSSGGLTYSTNGQESQQNSFLINGADSMDLRLNQALMVPSSDAIGEFNLIDSTINPEYGRNSGAILNAILKSGTNEFHGTVFEFYRDTFMNARNFFQATAPPFHQNQFGGVLDGPIVKNHLFFMASYQGTYNRRPDNNQLNTAVQVFTPDQRNGIFPDIATSTGTSPIPLAAESGATLPAGTAYSVLFPTGHIPMADLNPLSLKLMNQYVPLPNQGGGLFEYNPVLTTKENQGIARLDETISNKDALWGSLFLENTPAIHTLPFDGSTLPGFGEQDSSFTTQLVGAWNHTFNSNTLNELRFSFTRFNYKAVSPVNSALPSSFGFQGITPQFPNNASMPFVSLAGYFNLGFSPFGPQPVVENTYQLDDNFSKVHGSHTFKFGFDGRRYEVDNPYEAFNNGQFEFQGGGSYSTGDPGADFLLGFPDSFTQQSGSVQDFRTYEIYAYAQDSWKVKRNLTVNYGLGYQIDTPLENHYFNNLANNCFIPGEQSVIFPTAPVGLAFPGDKGCTLSGYYPHYDHVAPRFGFAWSPDWKGPITGGGGKFVVRGGFGVYYNRYEEELGLQQLSAAPFLINSVGASALGGAASPSFINPYKDIVSGQIEPSPFPFTTPKRGQNIDFSAFEPFDFNVSNPNFTSPYSMNFNLNVQRELPGSMVFQAAYVGSLGRHLEMVYEGNPISPAGQAACAANSKCVGDAFQGLDFPSHSAYAPGNVFLSVGTQATRGTSEYHSLQLSLNKRMSHGLQFLAAYTYSHSIDDTSGYESSGAANGVYRAPNPYALESSFRGDSTFDARQRFVVSAVWAIPSASKRWNNIFSRYVLDGWKLTGIETLQTGFPIVIFDTSLRSGSCPAADGPVYYACWDVPDVNGPVATYNVRNSNIVNTSRNPTNTASKPYYYFNPNAFSPEPIGVVGNEGRNNVHGPGINNTNLSLIKDIKFTEVRRLELRLDSFNTFNHTQFLMETGSLGYSNFSSSNFGRALSAAQGRVVQLALKFYF